MDQVMPLVTDVETKLDKITSITSAKGASQMGFGDVYTMVTQGKSVSSTINKLIKVYTKANPTPTESQALMPQMRHIFEMEEQQMKFALDNKTTFDKIYVCGMIKKNLVRNEQQGNALAELLIQKTEGSDKEEAVAIGERIRKGFEKTLGVYKGATGGEDKFD
ncbi:hypothetical protein HYFRA_00005586 [Hymenoscyphus fraxineus]|uniref:Uncharacterized protein n=1 Tax=Hymenoscyphus fraxineus TaxID=746836 RepID=A0A9N9KTM0_9HELO|nr:hypothetical protein HYFRA_00005586 [Hymenoscyphus fraxineus]